MLLLRHIIAIVLILGCVRSRKIPSKTHEIQGTEDDMDTEKKYLNVRRSTQQEMMRSLLLNSVLKDKSVIKKGTWLRESLTTAKSVYAGPTPKDPMADVVEKQLQHAASMIQSALLDRPYILKKGEREFLVLHPGDLDPFVTVIPNDIYYSVQKTCVNWLDDCNQQGIRAKLFTKMRSPY